MGAFSEVWMPSSEQLTALAHERAREKRIDFGAALREARQEFPLLSEQARQEALSSLVQHPEIVPAMFHGRPRSWERHKKIVARREEKQIPHSEAAEEIDAEEPDLAAAAAAEGGMQIRDIKQLRSGGEMYICSTELGRTVDPNRLFAETVSSRSERKGIDYCSAVREVARDYPRLTAAARRQVMGIK